MDRPDFRSNPPRYSNPYESSYSMTNQSKFNIPPSNPNPASTLNYDLNSRRSFNPMQETGRSFLPDFGNSMASNFNFQSGIGLGDSFSKPLAGTYSQFPADRPAQGGETPPGVYREAKETSESQIYGKVIKAPVAPAGPNAPLEDDYISNLKQQIHFLELEIKLMKDKEKQTNILSMFEELDTGPLSENIWALKQKYNKMQKDMEAKIKELTKQNGEFYNRFLAIQLNLERAFKERADIDSKKKYYTESYDGEILRLRQLLDKTTKEKEDNLKKLAEAEKEKDLAKAWVEELKNRYEKQSATLQQCKARTAEVDENTNSVVEEKNEAITHLQDELTHLQETIKNDHTIIDLKQKVEEMLKINMELDIERDNITMKIRALEYSKDISEKTHQQVLSEKRQLMTKIEELKKDIEKSKQQQENLLAKRLRERDNKELHRAFQQIDESRKEAKHFADQFNQKHTENVKLIDEIRLMKNEYDEVNLLLEHTTELNHDMKEKISNLNHLLQESNSHIDEERSTHHQLEIELTTLRKQSKASFEENSDLKARVSYMTRMLEANDQLKHINLDELRLLSKSNVQVNDTLNDLLGKWDKIQMFQKSV
jgi:chromosome segregation ATPase